MTKPRNPNPNTSGLRPPWKPGETGNPKNKNQKNRQSPFHFVKHMIDMTEDELSKVRDNPKTQINKKAAAQLLLDMIDEDPKARASALNTVMDRIHGKPHQSKTVKHERSLSAEQLVDRMRRVIGERSQN